MRKVALQYLFVVSIMLSAATPARAAAEAPVHCTLSNPLSCPNASYLSWAPGFAGAITHFIGGGKASYFRRTEKLSTQALFGLGVPYDERKSLPNGLFLFAGCPAHECGGQAAAVILDSRGRVKAIGFSSFHCGPRCDSEHRYLDFYVARAPNSDTITSALLSWGTGSSMRALVHDPHVDDGIEGRTVTHLMP